MKGEGGREERYMYNVGGEEGRGEKERKKLRNIVEIVCAGHESAGSLLRPTRKQIMLTYRH